MTTPYVLALDEGTTNAKAFAIAPDGAVLASGSAPVPVSYPRSGWVEQDADAVWSAQSAAIGACLEGVEGAPDTATAVADIAALNGLPSHAVAPGQVLELPRY